MANQLTSQSCLPNGLFLNNQSQVDQFATLYPGCKIIEGGLSVNGEDIKHLDGLTQITNIKGDVFITNVDSLQNIDGLQNVTSLGGTVRFQGLPSLTSLNLRKLTTVTGDFLYISDIPLVKSIDKLNALDTVTGIFQVWSMDTLSELRLDKLSFVGKDFALFRNRNIKNLNTLGNLNHIGDGLRLYENELLVDISGLSPILKIDGPLVINDNPLLSTCNTEAICNYIKNPSSFVAISNNASGCNNVPEVEASCISSTNNSEIQASMTVFPNPAFDQITIQNLSGKNQNLNIRNIDGKIILKDVNANTQINIQNLSPGIYILEVDTKRIKFVVSR